VFIVKLPVIVVVVYVATSLMNKDEYIIIMIILISLQCFDAVWLGGRKGIRPVKT